MFSVIYIPNFYLQATLRLEPGAGDQPVALVDTELTEPLIIQVNKPARQRGVQSGLTPSQGMARHGALLVKPRSPAREKSATDILLQVAYAFCADIEDTARGVCTMELKGLPLPDDAARQVWAAQILRTLAAFHLEACVGFAPTPDLALMAAQAARPVLIMQDAAKFIAGLPVAVLEPTREITEILRLWGIETVGAFVTLGKDTVVERLGEVALELFDRVSPRAVRPLKLVLPPERFTEQIEFENEIETLEPLLFILRQFLGQLTGRLAVIHLVAGELDLELGLVSGGKNQFNFKIPAPTNDLEILFRTLRTHLETVQTDSPIRSLSLAIQPVKLSGHQFSLFEVTLRNPNRFSETIARLGALCGAGRVGSPVLEATHQPDSFRMQSPHFNTPIQSANLELSIAPVLRRFRPAVPAVIHFREQKPVALRSPVFTGGIIKAEGPFVSSGHWWERPAWQREEWDARVADGSHYRIFRSPEGDFIEGVYD